jgi:hypothetical protein
VLGVSSSTVPAKGERVKPTKTMADATGTWASVRLPAWRMCSLRKRTGPRSRPTRPCSCASKFSFSTRRPMSISMKIDSCACGLQLDVANLAVNPVVTVKGQRIWALMIVSGTGIVCYQGAHQTQKQTSRAQSVAIPLIADNTNHILFTARVCASRLAGTNE